MLAITPPPGVTAPERSDVGEVRHALTVRDVVAAAAPLALVVGTLLGHLAGVPMTVGAGGGVVAALFAGGYVAATATSEE